MRGHAAGGDSAKTARAPEPCSDHKAESIHFPEAHYSQIIKRGHLPLSLWILSFGMTGAAP